MPNFTPNESCKKKNLFFFLASCEYKLSEIVEAHKQKVISKEDIFQELSHFVGWRYQEIVNCLNKKAFKKV